MTQEQRDIEFNGWFDELRLAFYKAAQTADYRPKLEGLKDMRRAFRKLEAVAAEKPGTR